MRTLSKEDFLDKLWILYNEDNAGDPMSTYTYLYNQFIDKDVHTFDGTLITFDLIVSKYSEYIKWWDSKYGEQDPKFISPKYKKVNISTFLIKSMYNDKYEIKRKKREHYLFGDLSNDELLTRVRRFKAQFNAEKKEEDTTTRNIPF